MCKSCSLWLACIVLAASGAAVNCRAADEPAEPLLGKALSTLFNPRSAPAQKTMGLLQRSFLDLVEESRPNLQIAFVIDGTDSMAEQLAGVRQSLAAMMNDLELYKASNISYQLVVFRDAGSPSGEVEYPLNAENRGFVADRAAVADAVNKIQPESGAPYFPELIDEGLHAALTQLGWSTDDDTSRWIFLFGDAPPFDDSFDEPENKARRRVGAGALVSLATEKGVRINSILCTSGEKDREAHEKVLDQTRSFMNTLSSKTGGLMLDLSYDDIRAAVTKAAESRPVEYEKIGVIRKEDVEQARQAAEAAGSLFTAGRRISIAVLPHSPLDKMSFEPGEEAVKLAAELRLRLRAIPGVEFKDTVNIRNRFKMLSNQGVEGEALLQMLAKALDVDYIMWGTLDRKGGAVVATTAFYDKPAGRQTLRAQAATNATVMPDQLGAMLADKLISPAAVATADPRLKSVFASIAQDQNRRDMLVVPVAVGAAQSPLLVGMEALEQSLAAPVGDPAAQELLATARDNLERAAESDAENPRCHFLLANCLFNQARAQQQAGDLDAARALMKDFATRLRQAERFRDNRQDAALRTEIEADHALLVRGNTPEAITQYRRLLDESTGIDAQAARRAHWMLAGIFSGDWGVDQKFVDRDEAKRLLTQILALWPDSSEAEFIRRALRWDDAEGGARFPHFPKENQDLAKLVERSA